MAIAEPTAAPTPTSVELSETFTINIRVYVYPQGDRWYAASTDYVLMAEGSSETEAVESFIESSTAYLRTALERGWIDALNRRPPLLRRIEIRRRVFLARLLRRHPMLLRRRLEFLGRSGLHAT